MTKLLLFLGLTLFPLYSFSSGGLQIAHVLLISAVLTYSVNGKINVPPGGQALAFVFLVAIFSECLYGIGLGSLSGLIHAMFFAFNLIVYIGVYSILVNHRQYTTYVTNGVVASCILALTGLFLYGVTFSGEAITSRAIGTFNNPNQLGYYACILFSFGSLLSLTGHLNRYVTLAVGLASLLFAAACLSKAALLSIGLPFTLIMFITFRFRLALGLTIIILAIIFGSIYFFGLPSNFENLLALKRISEIGADSDDNLAARGYFVLLSPSANFVDFFLGFSYYGVLDVHSGDEIHSTFVYVLGTYGVFAGLAYIVFLSKWVVIVFSRLNWVGLATVVAPCFLFGITHTGVRFTFFYVLVAATYAILKCENSPKAVR